MYWRHRHTQSKILLAVQLLKGRHSGHGVTLPTSGNVPLQTPVRALPTARAPSVGRRERVTHGLVTVHGLAFDPSPTERPKPCVWVHQALAQHWLWAGPAQGSPLGALFAFPPYAGDLCMSPQLGAGTGLGTHRGTQCPAPAVLAAGAPTGLSTHGAGTAGTCQEEPHAATAQGRGRSMTPTALCLGPALALRQES